MRVEFLKELLEDSKHQNMTVKQFTATIKESGVWDFDPNIDKVTAKIDALPRDDTCLGENPYINNGLS